MTTNARVGWVVGLLSLALLPGQAIAANDMSTVDDECVSVLRGYPLPTGPDRVDFNRVQMAKMLNHPALSMMVSGLGAPLRGGGRVGLELAQIPSLGCLERTVVHRGRFKTEDSNQVAVFPRPRLSFAMPEHLGFRGGLTLAYVPPVKLGSTSAHSVGFSLNVSRTVLSELDVGLRLHGLTGRISDDIARNTNKDGPVYNEFYSPGLIGVGMNFGYYLDKLLKGTALWGELDYTNVGTFLAVGDDGVVVNNSEPFLGLVYSLGLEHRWRFLEAAASFNQAPGSSYAGWRIRVAYRWD